MSFVSQQFLVFDNATLANFKNWGLAISQALSSSGWVQTADTGQVNWSTIASVPASGSFVYEVWKPADALQTGTTVYFMKLKYGTSSGSPAAPRFQMQLGTGTDGAGNLTGVTTSNTEYTNSGGAGTGATVYDCYFSGDIDRFGMLMWRSKGADLLNPILMTIERTKDTSGNNNSDGVIRSCGTGGNTGGYNGLEIIVFNGPGFHTISSGRYYPGIYSGFNAGDPFNNNIPFTPAFPIYGKIGNPMTTLGGVHTQDVSEGSVFTVTLYGATRTYISTQFWTYGTGLCPCMRYD